LPPLTSSWSWSPTESVLNSAQDHTHVSRSSALRLSHARTSQPGVSLEDESIWYEMMEQRHLEYMINEIHGFDYRDW
jgi:hypothetical protein